MSEITKLRHRFGCDPMSTLDVNKQKYLLGDRSYIFREHQLALNDDTEGCTGEVYEMQLILRGPRHLLLYCQE